MKNELALKLVEAINKYAEQGKSAGFEGSEEIYEQDCEDLTSIAQMIESNESPKAIREAMWKLDTLVRDVIPDKVYYHFNK